MRSITILSKLVKLGFRIRNKTKAEQAITIRKTIEELGSIYVKFGQMLALRPDVISPELSIELYKLLDQVPPFSENVVREILTQELQKSPEEIFEKFLWQPVASASLSQVHQAIYHGQIVAVKIQRPQIKSVIKSDFRILNSLSWLLDQTLFRHNHLLVDLVKEFADWTYLELDYVTEVNQLLEFNQLKNINLIKGPKIYPELCTAKVIVMEYLDGISLAKIIKAQREDDKEILRKVKQWGFERKDIVTKIIKNMLETAHLEGFFHADPHPANIMFTREGKCVLIDFGIIGRFNSRESTLVLRYERAMLSNDADIAFKSLLALSIVPANLDISGIKAQHDQLVGKLSETYSAVEYLDQQKQAAPLILASLQLIQNSGIKIPVTILRYFKAFETIEGLIFALYPEFQVRDMVAEFQRITFLNLQQNLTKKLGDFTMENLFLKMVNHLEEHLLEEE
ncbi:MAG: AarF/UbiB family protein [bacterium]